jgi:hypothetical protein
VVERRDLAQRVELRATPPRLRATAGDRNRILTLLEFHT